MAGVLDVWLTWKLLVSVGTSQSGVAPVIGNVTVFDDCDAREIVAFVLSRGSMKNASGATPLLVMLTGTVTGVPLARVVLALSGSPAALACTPLKTMLPV